MALRTRGGNTADFDPNKMLPREPATVTDAKEIKWCVSPGDVRTLATIEDMTEAISTADQQIIAELTAGANAAASLVEDTLDGANNYIDDTTGTYYKMGVNNGVAYIETVAPDPTKPDAPNIYSYLNESTGSGIITGLAVTAQTTPDMTVNVTAGTVHLPSGKRYSISSSTTITVSTASTAYPRIDIIYVSSAGAISYLTGTPASSPTAPVLPTGGELLAQIGVAVSQTTVASTNITDKRTIKYSGIKQSVSNMVQNDTTNDSTKYVSASVAYTHGQEIDAINTALTKHAGTYSVNSDAINSYDIKVYYNSYEVKVSANINPKVSGTGLTLVSITPVPTESVLFTANNGTQGVAATGYVFTDGTLKFNIPTAGIEYYFNFSYFR